MSAALIAGESSKQSVKSWDSFNKAMTASTFPGANFPIQGPWRLVPISQCGVQFPSNEIRTLRLGWGRWRLLPFPAGHVRSAAPRHTRLPARRAKKILQRFHYQLQLLLRLPDTDSKSLHLSLDVLAVKMPNHDV